MTQRAAADGGTRMCNRTMFRHGAMYRDDPLMDALRGDKSAAPALRARLEYSPGHCERPSPSSRPRHAARA